MYETSWDVKRERTNRELTIQPINQSTNQLIDQSTNQPVNHLTLMLYQFKRTIIAVLGERVPIKRPMLDSGYSILDNLHDNFSATDRHRASSNQYRVSAVDCKVFPLPSKVRCYF